jgi:hypothetical protein
VFLMENSESMSNATDTPSVGGAQQQRKATPLGCVPS